MMKSNAKTGLILSGILMVSAFYLNFNDFITGHAPNAVSFCSSILFAASCCCLSFMKKSGRLSAALAVYTGFIAIVSLAASIVGAYRLPTGWPLLLVDLATMPPYYGLSLICNIYAAYLMIFIFGTLLCIVNVYFWKKKKGGGKSFGRGIVKFQV